jgi:predicted RNase H-like HicB family nuclease
MRTYVILIEQGPENLSAFVPSLPGCVAAAETRSELLMLMAEAIQGHIEVMLEYGETVPDETLEAVTLVIPAFIPQDK